VSYKGVIFDLDGVIVSTDRFHYNAWSALAKREGIPFSEEINHRLRGVSRRESLDIILEKSKKKYTEPQIQEMMTFKNDLYRDSLKELTKEDILPGVMDLIAFLRSENILIAIGSSSKNTKTILKFIGLEHSFDAIVDGNDIAKSKPDPEVFLKAGKKLRLKVKNCIVIEDAIAGIQAAKRAGMFAVAVSDALKSEEADFYASDILDIKTLF